MSAPPGLALLAAVLLLPQPAFAEAKADTESWRAMKHVERTTNATTLLTFHGPATGLTTFSPDGQYLATLSAGKAVLWDATTGKKRHILQGHKDAITDVAFSPDGKCVATVAHWDYTARLWEAATGRPVRTLTWRDWNSKRKVEKIEGGWGESISEGWIYRSMENGVAFSPGGKQLATPGYLVVTLTGLVEDEHGQVRLWDVTTGKPTITLSGHKADVNAVAYSPDGRQLASGSQDGTILIW